MTGNDKPLTYANAGVDIDRGNEFVRRIRGIASFVINPLVLAHIGGFAGAMELPEGYSKPVLIASADGVGSKIKLATLDGNHLLSIGQDLVAMVVNDIVCCGAKPLFFLDYFATNQIQSVWHEYVIRGIVDALAECDCTLLGGETAELPGTFSCPEDFDVAGFGVGIVEKSKIIDGHTNVREGDVVVGISSNGPHSNGYTLIRQVLDRIDTCSEENINAIMKPTTLYAPAILKVLEQVEVKAIAHITGGGLIENIPRIVDKWYRVVLDVNSWDMPAIFGWLQSKGNIPIPEMYRVFNMGIGMVLIVDSDVTALQTINVLAKNNLTAQIIGRVETRDNVLNDPQVVLS